MRCCLLVAIILTSVPLNAAEPQVVDPNLILELVAAEPDIVTPTGIAVDAKGRVWCLENHTHQRPANYNGPPTDRLRVFEEFDEKGKACKVWTFAEGFRDSMGLTFGKDGSIYVATRAVIYRLREKDGKETERTPLIKLETKGNYPHNGLCGFAWDFNGDLIFGLGENLGESYTLIGSDGGSLSGGGEGGSMYRCRPDGSKVTRIATGFWNPFAHCFDAAGRLFMVDNDPDARGPCRLCHVIQGGDYGYRFRYGRKGLHPFNSWNGELPGTLPMAAGTSEAPSGVLACDFTALPADYAGKLLVTSWGDHTIEAFTLAQRGASVTATSKVIVRGDQNFRPVGFAIAPDGSVIFSDWVDQSYPVHGKGRIWRLRARSPQGILKSPPQRLLPATEADWHRIATHRTVPAEQMEALLHLKSPELTRPFIPLLANTDPFIMSAALEALGRPGNVAMLREALDARPHATLRLGLLLALRRTGEATAREALPRLLSDDDPDVRRAAIQWVAEEKITEHATGLREYAFKPPVTRGLLEAWLKADQMLTGRMPAEEEGDQNIANFVLLNDKLPAEVRAIALRMLPADHKMIDPGLLERHARGDDELARECVRTLVYRRDDRAAKALRDVVQSSPLLEMKRLAITGLAAFAERQEIHQFLMGLLDNPELQADAQRALDREPKSEKRTPEQWREILKDARGDVAAGERVFVHPRGPACYNCHRIDARGGNVGPDLTFVGRSMSRDRLIESILEPSKEVAPMYTAWRILTRDGKERIGLIREAHDSFVTIVDSAGKAERLKRTDIEERVAVRQSIMPDELPHRMSRQEFIDLLAYLMARK